MSQVIQWPFSGPDGIVHLHLVLRGTLVLLVIQEIVAICSIGRTSFQKFMKRNKTKGTKATSEEMAILRASGGVKPATFGRVGLQALGHVATMMRRRNKTPGQVQMQAALTSITEWHKARLERPSYMPPLPDRVSATWRADVHDLHDLALNQIPCNS